MLANTSLVFNNDGVVMRSGLFLSLALWRR